MALFFFLNLVAVLFKNPFQTAIHGWDNSFYYFWLRSPFVGGDFDFRDDIKETDTLNWKGAKELASHQPVTATGLLPNKYGIGWALSSVPFYLLAEAIVRFLNGFGVNIVRDGYGPTYQFMILLGQFLYGGFSLYLSYGVLRKWFDKETALIGVLLTWSCGFLFFYQVYELSMAHNITYFAMAAAYFFAHRVEQDGRTNLQCVLLGISSGLLVISRYQAVLYLLYPCLVVWRIVARDRKALRRVWLCAASAMLVISLQMGAWRIVYGSWLVYSYGNEAFNWLNPQIWNVLFSPFHGLFYWSPIYVLSFLGLVHFITRQGGLPWSFLIIFLCVCLVNASWWIWWFGWAFGARAFEGCVLFFMIGTAALFSNAAKKPVWRLAFLISFVAAAIFNVSLAYAAVKHDLPWGAPVTYRQMITVLHYSLVPEPILLLEEKIRTRLQK